MMTKFYKFNHQIFKIEESQPADKRYFLYNQNKQIWQACMVFQIIQLNGAIKRKQITEMSDINIFTELL